jgi:hypothetical protein
MSRLLYLVLGAGAFSAALTVSVTSRADTLDLEDGCSFEYSTGCSASCTPSSINCNVQFADSCAKSCTETATKTCTTACATECMTNPGSFTCSSYCSGQCETECTSNNNCGAATETDCVTGCQGQCSYSCNLTPPTTTCSTECATSCTAKENTVCSVKCQVHESESCSITPATCSASCGGTGGVILCNGQVVYVASTILDAGQWYIAHLDAQFDIDKFSLGATTSCTGSDCKATVSCATSPGAERVGGEGFFFAGLGFAAVAASRRRRARP